MSYLFRLLIAAFLISAILSNASAHDLSKSIAEKSSLDWSYPENSEQEDIIDLSTVGDTTGVQTLFYKPRIKQSGSMWDTWLYYHQGNYYLYYLASSTRKVWDNISMARSTDGVHWAEMGPVLSKGEAVWMGTGSIWKSADFKRDGKFYMNFSEQKEGKPQTISFAESKDLVHWNKLGKEHEFVQDERWYKPEGRWDCIWTIPRPGGGYYGYWTATPKAETGGLFGFGESIDGITWKALAPPKVSLEGVDNGEVGAVARIGSKYYMMFGTGGFRMVTLIAEKPEGPFVASEKNLTLMAGHTYFSRFFHAPGGLLVDHQSFDESDIFGEIYFGTLKEAEVDAEGTLRLAWWTGNEKLKGEALKIKMPSQDSITLPKISMLQQELDVKSGIVMEGQLRLPALKESQPIGLYIAESNKSGTGILIYAKGITELGKMESDGSGFSTVNKVDRERTFGKTAHFRLLLKGRLLEFYLDDLLIQCYTLKQDATGRVGLIWDSPVATIYNIKAWRCVPDQGSEKKD